MTALWIAVVANYVLLVSLLVVQYAAHRVHNIQNEINNIVAKRLDQHAEVITKYLREALKRAQKL